MSIPYIGDFAEDATVYHYFNTFDSNDPAASVTMTTLIDSDLYVYKDGSVTNIVTDGASVVIDFDSRTGVHKLTIDTSVHADYAIGSDYMILIEGATVDGGNVTAAICTFSIENRFNEVDVTKVGGSATNVSALATNVDAINTLAAGATGFTAIDTVVDAIKVVTDAIGATGTGLSAIPWNPAWDAEVESEVNDAIDTAISELGVAAPTATPTLRTGLMLLYMALRNKTDVPTSGTDALEIHNDAGTIIAKKLLTDAGGDYSEAKMVSG